MKHALKLIGIFAFTVACLVYYFGFYNKENLDYIAKKTETKQSISNNFFDSQKLETKNDRIEVNTEKKIEEKKAESSKDNLTKKENIDKSKDSFKENILEASTKNQDIFDNKTFHEAEILVADGRAYLKNGTSFLDLEDEINAQLNFKEALINMDLAIKKLNEISKKFAGNKYFEKLDSDANGLKFFLEKSCIR